MRRRAPEILDELDAEVCGCWDPSEKIVAVALGIGVPVRTARHETIHAPRQTASSSTPNSTVPRTRGTNLADARSGVVHIVATVQGSWRG